jgi:hypothetical protein
MYLTVCVCVWPLPLAVLQVGHTLHGLRVSCRHFRLALKWDCLCQAPSTRVWCL